MVIGGGPAGCSTALRLRQQGATVTLIEKSDYSQQRPGESLAPEAIGFLNQLGVRDRFDAEAFQQTSGLLVSWGSVGISFSSFLTRPFGSGWNLDRARFDRMLSHACRQSSVKVVFSRQSIQFVYSHDRWELQVGRDSYRSPVIVDATGRASAMATRFGVQRIHDDHLIALVSYRDEQSCDPRLVIESTPDGWWYSAGLPGDVSVTAFLTDVDLIPKRPEERTTYFTELLEQTRFAHRGIAPSSPAFSPRLVRANTSRLSRPSSSHWFAVGDAAIATSPLSGNGIVRALETGLLAADAIVSTDTNASQRYNEVLASMREESEAQARATYSQEKRWATTFWQRRHSTLPSIKSPLVQRAVGTVIPNPQS